MKRFFFKYVLSLVAWTLYQLFYLTWRVRIIEPPELKRDLASKTPFILAHWHGDEAPLFSTARRYHLATIASTSVDGEMMNSMLFLNGARTSRGSSTRGAVHALKGLIRLVKSGRNCSFAVDGPKGPIYKVKPGVFEMSRLIQARIYAAGVSCDSKWVFKKSWNQAFFPKPFAKVIIHWSAPMGPVSKEEDPRDPKLAESLEELLRRSKDLAAKTLCDTQGQMLA